ncbi:glycine cleavage system protein GcvH [Gracilibacillus salinarum]|uniref:Glycine cleavage system H protein n=1 Tax=Gracilibacillus salinarum TaxID=2932255 RepID=A0ABY4GI78_9BACI|nr:glycine cleavage system protein GcvH [Gracilibacillus salinarum]UOQ84053.1 glycine cleavage system protein GcvH [Gracilibacillus salinarum]
MTTKTEMRYTKDHEWVIQIDDQKARIGITDFAQEQLGDIVFVESAEVGSELKAGETMGTIESVKAASDIYSPLSGRVITVNEALEHEPEIVNEDPFHAGWLIEIEVTNAEEFKQLLIEKDYYDFIKEGE